MRLLARTVCVAGFAAVLQLGLPAIADPAPQPPAEQELARDTYELSLLDAVELALRQNLRVQISRVATEISREGITGAQGLFDPTLTFNTPQFFTRSVSPQGSQIDGTAVSVTENFSGGFSFNERLEWGTQWSLQWSANRSVSNSTFITVNPRLVSNLSFSITQPLLRGFGSEVNREQILVADNNYSRSQEQFRLDVQQVALDTYRGYWNLVLRYQEVEVRDDALQLARQQLARSQRQQEFGTGRTIDVAQGEVRVADEEVRVLQVRLALEDAQDALKRLLNVDEMGSQYWEVEFVPTDVPEYVVRGLDVGEAVRAAYESDPQLAQLRIDLETRGIQVRTARNNLLPSLDLSASLRLDGQGGNNIVRSGVALGGAVSEIQAGGFTDSLQQLFSGDFRTWSVGATLTMPVHNWQARAASAQSILQQRQVGTRIADREQELFVNIKVAIRRLESLNEQVEAAIAAREAAERQLDLSELQFELGVGDVFQQLQFQVDLANTRSRELQLIIDFNNAFADFEATKGTLLETLGINVAAPGGRR